MKLFPHSSVPVSSLCSPTTILSCTPCHHLLFFIFPACRFINHWGLPAVCFYFAEHHLYFTEWHNGKLQNNLQRLSLNAAGLCVLVSWCDWTFGRKHTSPAGVPLNHGSWGISQFFSSAAALLLKRGPSSFLSEYSFWPFCPQPAVFTSQSFWTDVNSFSFAI